MKNKKIRGYITARKIDGELVPQKIQNLVLREFCNKNNYIYQLSSVEYKMANSYLILDSIMEELPQIGGIVMYSFFQLPEDKKKRNGLFKKILKQKKFISFALENITVQNKNDFLNFDTLFNINSLLKFCPKKI